MKSKDSMLAKIWHELLGLIKSAGNRVSKVFDKVVYNKTASLVVSGIFAVVFAVSINYEDLSFQLFHADASSLTLSSIPVEVLVDTDIYEVSGVPSSADITVIGDAADLQLVRTQNSATIKADLRSLTEGTSVVTLEAGGLPSGLEVSVSPSTVDATLQKKYTKTFFVSAELLIGTGQSESDFESPVLAVKSVTITATREKLNSIRSVKAIIDASGHDTDFTVNAPLVAYDSAGKTINVTISPDSVSASVKMADSLSSDSDSVSDNASAE